MRTALVGGASKGLGLACAIGLASRGHRLVLCARTPSDLESAAATIRTMQEGLEVVTVPCDFSKRDNLLALNERLKSDCLKIDILINNVGGPQPGTVVELTEEQWEHGLDLLFRSTLRLYRMVLPGMQERGWGRIINILSPAAVEPVASLAISSVLRAALANYAKLVAKEVGRHGITVNSLMPGGFRTARTDELERDTARRRNVSVQIVQRENEAAIPIQRMLDPKELANFVAYLTSDEAGGITGALLPIDGGQMRTI